MEKFFKIYNFFIDEMGLKSNEIIIFAIISSFCEQGDFCSKEFSFFSKWSNLSRQCVINTLQSLIEKNYIKKGSQLIKNVKRCYYYVNIEKVNHVEIYKKFLDNQYKKCTDPVQNITKKCTDPVQNVDVYKNIYNISSSSSSSHAYACTCERKKLNVKNLIDFLTNQIDEWKESVCQVLKIDKLTLCELFEEFQNELIARGRAEIDEDDVKQYFLNMARLKLSARKIETTKKSNNNGAIKTNDAVSFERNNEFAKHIDDQLRMEGENNPSFWQQFGKCLKNVQS